MTAPDCLSFPSSGQFQGPSLPLVCPSGPLMTPLSPDNPKGQTSAPLVGKRCYWGSPSAHLANPTDSLGFAKVQHSSHPKIPLFHWQKNSSGNHLFSLIDPSSPKHNFCWSFPNMVKSKGSTLKPLLIVASAALVGPNIPLVVPMSSSKLFKCSSGWPMGTFGPQVTPYMDPGVLSP